MRPHAPAASRGGSAARALSAVIFAALLALILLTCVPYGSVEPRWEAAFECAVFALAALAAVEAALACDFRWRQVGLALPLLALAAYALAQTVQLGGGELWQAVSADPYQTRRWALKLLALTLALAMLLRHTRDERRLRALVAAVLAAGVASALFGLFRQTTQRGQGFLFLSALAPGEGYAQFVNRNHFAFLAEMALGLALGVVVGGGASRERKLVYLALSLPLWAALVLANSRGGLFAMLGLSLFLASAWGAGARAGAGRPLGSRPARAALLCGLLLFALIGTVWMGGDPLVTRLETVPGEVRGDVGSREGSSRAEIWRATWSLVKDHPLAGVGFGGYWAAIPQYHEASGEATPQEAHNDYLELLASGGLLGLLPAVWFLAAFARRARRAWGDSPGYRRAACLGALAGLSGVALHSLVDFGLHVTANALAAAALVVVATADVGGPASAGRKSVRGWQKTIPSGHAKRIEGPGRIN